MGGKIGMKSGKRIYQLKENYFDKWSHNMAYILGFISADGSITGGYSLTIMLHKKDIEVLQFMISEICPQIPIRELREKYVKISFNSIAMINSLQKYNVVPNKSKIINFDFDIPNKYFGDYLRGVFDGDGCVMCRNNTIESTFASGSLKFLQALRKRAGNIGYISKQSSRKETWICYRWAMSKTDTLKLRDMMYPSNGFALSRKKNKFFSDFYIPSDRWWTKEQIAYLRKHFQSRTPGTLDLIAKELGKSYKSVNCKASRLGLRAIA